MSQTLSRRGFVGIGVGCILSTVCNPSHAGKPVPYPAVVPNYDFNSYADRYADLGGVFDVNAGLVWGYEPNGSFPDFGYGVPWKTDAQVSQYYRNALANQAASLQSQGKSAEAQAYLNAYSVASQFAWRLPTVMEARDASVKGLFTVGTGFCNKYFGNPVNYLNNEPGLGLPNYNSHNARWTSTLGKKIGGVQNAYAWRADTGEAGEFTVTSQILLLVVRSYSGI